MGRLTRRINLADASTTRRKKKRIFVGRKASLVTELYRDDHGQEAR